jgi:hypothetical protein
MTGLVFLWESGKNAQEKFDSNDVSIWIKHPSGYNLNRVLLKVVVYQTEFKDIINPNTSKVY